MKYTSRSHVEQAGKAGVWSIDDADGLRARQLGDFWIYLDRDDNGYTNHAVNDGFWEAWITFWMSNNVVEGSRVLDIGANHGYYSFMLAASGCTVVAVEPQPGLAELIRRSNSINPFHVEVMQKAVGDVDGDVTMMVPIHHGMNATISNSHSYAPDGSVDIVVPCVTLDSLDSQVDFIKIDAEGSEYKIWQGSRKFRASNPDCLILMEWRWDRYENAEQFAAELFSEYTINYITFDGVELPMETVDQLGSKRDSDWMLVLRRKQ